MLSKFPMVLFFSRFGLPLLLGVVMLLGDLRSSQVLSAQAVQLSIPASNQPLDLPATQTFDDLAGMKAYLSEWRSDQFAQAYWEASVDSLYRIDSLHYAAVLHLGPRYRWGNLRPASDIPPRWLSKANFRPRAFRNRPLDHDNWLRVRDSLAVVAANHGYPFASVRLDSIEWQSAGQLAAVIRIDKDSLVLFGAPDIPEPARVNPDFMARYLGITAGAPYSRRLVRRIPARLKRLPYLRLTANPTVNFAGKRANLEIPLERKPASRFDFVIGVLPNSNQTGKLLLTGELNGELQNGLGQGERIAARFQQLRPQTQELQLAFDYPYLLGLPFGLSLEGELYRRDTQFINLNYRAAATYRWRTGNRIDVFWSRRQTNLLGFDAARVLATNQLPDTLDVGRSFFGVSIQRSETDQIFNPRRGYELSLSAAAGSRRIRRNGKLLDLGLGPRYDSLELNTAQYNLSTSLALYRPLFAGTVLYLGIQAAAFLSDQPLLANEQFRLGGAKLLRGFDEQQIFASAYGILTSEFRLLLGNDAYLYAFGDFAWVNPRNRSRPAAKADFPIGFGTGISFNSRAGIFSVSLALGRRSGEVLDVGAPKVHFGYLSVF